MKYAIALAITLLIIFVLSREDVWSMFQYGEPAKVEDDLHQLTGEL